MGGAGGQDRGATRRHCAPPSTATTTSATGAATPTSSSRPAFLRPLRTPPFYAVLGVRFCHGTEGGAKIDENMAVSEARRRSGRRPLRDRRQHQRLGGALGPARHHPGLRFHLRIHRGGERRVIRRIAPANDPRRTRCSRSTPTCCSSPWWPAIPGRCRWPIATPPPRTPSPGRST